MKFECAPVAEISASKLAQLQNGAGASAGLEFVPVCRYGAGMNPRQGEIGCIAKVDDKATIKHGIFTFHVIDVRSRLFLKAKP